MSSMLRQHHVKIQDLVNYLRGYDPAKPQTAEDWSKQESSGFEPGMLLFCLERVSAPSGLAFGKKDSEGETYRVKDLCVVVGRDNNRSLVVNITASAFELRYLEVLMLEKARKAILDGKDFLYVAVKPGQPLGDSKLREIEELGAMYAQGGSRRSLVVDASGPQEPAVALLAALGVKLSIGGIGKQVLDIGSICHMLFAPEGRQEDKNKQIVKACFHAIPNNEPIGKGGQNSAVTPQAPSAPPQRIRPAPAPAQPPQDWSASPANSGWAQDLQTPDQPPAPPAFGYEQPEASPSYSIAPGALGFGYEKHPPAAAAGFGYEQPPTASAEPTPWHQPAPGATGGFGLDGLNPFAPPTETGEDVGQYEHTDLVPPDFASQFKDDLEKGLAGESAIRFEESQMVNDAEQSGIDSAREFSQNDYEQKFAPPPDLDYGQAPSSAQQYSDEQFPPSSVFTERAFGADHFQTPDFGSAADFGAQPASTELTGPPQEMFSSFPTVPTASSAQEDFFKPPYEGATATGEFELPAELTAKLDPKNQLFQAADADSKATPATEAAVPEVNFGFDAFNQQPPSEFVDSVFDTTSGAFEKTSRTMSFEEEGEPESVAKTPAPAEVSAPASVAAPDGTNWSLPTEDWAQTAPASTDWGVDPPPAPSGAIPWTPEPSAADWAPETAAATPEPEAAMPQTWSFEGASQAPAWHPEPVEPVSTSASWTPAAKPVTPASSGTSWKPVEPMEPPSSGASWTPAAESTEPAASGASWAPVGNPNEPVASGTSWTATEKPAQPQAEESEPASTTPSLFERLNQQLQKGSLSEIEPAPDAPALAAGHEAVAAASNPVEAASVEAIVETTLNHNIAADSQTGNATESVPLVSPDMIPASEYASTPLPPPAVKEAPRPVPAPLPLGVSKKNAPLILPWPSAADPEPARASNTANNLPAVPTPTTISDSRTVAAEAPVLESPETSSTNLTKVTGAGDGIKHLAEALSGLMGGEEDPHPLSPFAKIKPPVAETPAPPEPPPELPIAAATEAAIVSDVASQAPAEAVHANIPPAAPETGKPVAPVIAEAPVPAAEPIQEDEYEEEELSPSAVLAAKGFHQPRLVMNEMASLMSKLEQQVQKAAKKLNARAEEIKQRLLAQVDGLVSECVQIEKESQRSTTNLSQRLIKQLDEACEESRLKVSDIAANGRYTIKQLLTANQTNVDETKNTLYESLREACKQFRIETEALARTAETDLNELVNSRTEELNKVVQSMNTHLDDTNSGFNDKLNARYERFKERMSDEASSVVRSLERNVKSMVEEIDGSWDRASDKLKSSKSDFDQTIHHSVKTAELNLSQSTRLILTNALIPKLRERQQVLRMTSVELSKRFTDESEAQVSGQILGLEASLGAARQQLQTLVDDCMSSIDAVGRGQQAGLEDIFKETSAHAERATIEATEFLTKIETQITENEQTCKRLAETSSIDNDVELSNERNEATQRVQQLRQQANAELTNAIDQGCMKLEQLSNTIQGDVSALRVEHTQTVRDAAENGLTRVRDAIQEAFSAIQAAREKYME